MTWTIGEYGGKILLPFGRSKRRTGQLLILHADAITTHGFFKHLEIVARHLMAEPTRAAMHHHHDLLVAGDAMPTFPRVEDTVVFDDLDFPVTGPKRTELVDPTRDRMTV